MLTKIVDVEISKTCRVCLKYIEGEMIRENSYIEMYEQIIQIKVVEGIYSPINICKSCINELILYDTFRTKCLNNEKSLLEYKRLYEQERLTDNKSVCGIDVIENDTTPFNEKTASDSKQIQKNYGCTLVNNNTQCECLFCNKLFENDILLRSHVEKYHSEILWDSNKDCEEYKHSDLLNSSFTNEHVGKNVQSCSVCNVVFCTFSKLLLHMGTHSADGLLQCEKCPKTFKDYKTLTKHVRNHTGKPFLCHNCGKTFQRSSDYTVHLRTHTGDKPYECATCHKKFKTSYMCNIHSRIHTGEKPSQCKICNKRFISNSHLYIHMRSHNKLHPYICKECGRAFAQEKDLEIHGTLHSGQTLFQCDSCGRGFNRKNNLLKHIKLHQGTKIHVCQTCSFAFPTSTQLKTHLRTHTGDRPYKCDQCLSTFASSSGVSRHKKTHKKSNIDKSPIFVEDVSHNKCENHATNEMVYAKDTQSIYVQDIPYEDGSKHIIYEIYDHVSAQIIDEVEMQTCMKEVEN